MSTEFRSIENCLVLIAGAAKTTRDDAEQAFRNSRRIYIGWPQDQDAMAFDLGNARFAISEFREGWAIWSIDPNTGCMVRW